MYKMIEQIEFEPGDLVMLKSSSPKMVIKSKHNKFLEDPSNIEYTCTYYCKIKEDFYENKFLAVELIKANEEN